MLKKLLFFIVLLLGTTDSYSQIVNRTWLDGLRNATVAIGKIVEKEEIQDSINVKRRFFKVLGTGILVRLTDSTINRPFLITARHLIIDPKTNTYPNSIQVRFSWFEDKNLEENIGITIKLKIDNIPNFLVHPDNDVDLVIIPLDVSQEEAGRSTVAPLSINNFESPDGFYEGRSLFVLGFPGQVPAEFSTKTILRTGSIAWVSPIAPDSNYILIDCNIFPGNSGGPVFTVPTGIDRSGSFNVGGEFKFIGIVSSIFKQPFETLIEEDPLIITDKGKILNIYAISSMALCKVEPAVKVKELLDEVVKIYHTNKSK